MRDVESFLRLESAFSGGLKDIPEGALNACETGSRGADEPMNGSPESVARESCMLTVAGACMLEHGIGFGAVEREAGVSGAGTDAEGAHCKVGDGHAGSEDETSFMLRSEGREIHLVKRDLNDLKLLAAIDGAGCGICKLPEGEIAGAECDGIEDEYGPELFCLLNSDSSQVLGGITLV